MFRQCCFERLRRHHFTEFDMRRSVFDAISLLSDSSIATSLDLRASRDFTERYLAGVGYVF